MDDLYFCPTCGNRRCQTMGVICDVCVRRAQRGGQRGIPTKYKGVQFRSRIEARWAAFFDRLEWPWEYETFDLERYIPDFTLNFPHKPILVEVKYELSLDTLEPHAKKMESTSWSGEGLIVGACLFHTSGGYDPGCSVGMIGERAEDTDEPPWMWTESALIKCKCGFGVNSSTSLYNCRRCGYYRGGSYDAVPLDDAKLLWADASNEVQWRKPKSTP